MTKLKIIGVVSQKVVCIEYAGERRTIVSTSDLAPTSDSMNPFIDFEHDESENHIAEKPPIQENSKIPVSVNTQLSPIPSAVHDEVIEPSSDSPITRPSRSAEEATQKSHFSTSQITDSPVKPTMVCSPDTKPSGRPSCQRKAPGHLKDYVVDF